MRCEIGFRLAPVGDDEFGRDDERQLGPKVMGGVVESPEARWRVGPTRAFGLGLRVGSEFSARKIIFGKAPSTSVILQNLLVAKLY